MAMLIDKINLFPFTFYEKGKRPEFYMQLL